MNNENRENLEYFRETVKFTGRHSRYIDDLWTQNVIKESYVKTLYELYGLAAIVGLRIKKTSPIDNTDGVRNLQAEQLTQYRPILKTIMITVLLLDETSGLSEEERINRAFRGPSNVDEMKADMRLFDSYVRAGIEFLHEELVERPLSFDDNYTDQRVGNIVALLEKEF